MLGLWLRALVYTLTSFEGFMQSKEHAFHSKAVSEFSLLRREQAKLERETGQHLFVGLSLIHTVRTCIR
jgi:hypothetical protein